MKLKPKNNRALGVDANMKHHLAGLIDERYEQLKKEKEHIRQHLLAQTKISNELLDEKEKLTQALKVAEKALRYMTEDYDCDPADVADFDKRRADQALEQIKKIMGESCSNETTKEQMDKK